VNASDEHPDSGFIDALGDKWQEFTVHHPKLNMWMQITGETDVSESPYMGSTASEIDWQKRVELQSIVQKYTTHSISSTLNLSQNTPADMVGSIYFEAWKRGLKGITVYREGSRQGVLISETGPSAVAHYRAALADHPAPLRPRILEAEVVRFMNNDERWMAFVGLLHNRPYEVFTGRVQDGLILPVEVSTGWIVKNGNGPGGISVYDFQYVDQHGVRFTVEGLSRAFNKEYWNYAKFISGVLRHGMPLTDVVDLISNLKLYSDNINTWKNGVERALKRFIPDGTPAKNQSCMVCGDEQGLVFEEGCMKCRSCGYSKCN
jgi:ribonucleoside-diphosphate reductase alpha chain